MQTARQYESEQAEQLQAWIETRRRGRRVQIVPKTQEEIEMARLLGIMDGIGITVGVMAVIGLLALLVYHISWWVLPAVASATALGWLNLFRR